MAKIGDLKGDGFPPLDWSGSDTSKYLDAVYDHVVAKAKDAQDWYFRKKRPKQLAGFWLRVTAIVAATLAGILPVLSEISERTADRLYVSPGWAAILLAISGLCILLNKFGDYTNGWIRYVLTATQIGRQLDDFHFAWQRAKLGLAGQIPTHEQVRQLLTLCQEFTAGVTALVADETKQWAVEFESALKVIEAATKEVHKTEATGAVNVKVVNGEKGPWQLRVDQSATQYQSGTHAAVRGLWPTVHVISVTGQINGQAVSDEKAVKVLGGEIVDVELELKTPPGP
jgi:hypothetical protein